MYWIKGVPMMPSPGEGGRGPGRGFWRAAEAGVAVVAAEEREMWEAPEEGGGRMWCGGGPWLLLPLWLLLRDMGRGAGPGGVSYGLLWW
jgi:hypothetical protein